MSEVFKIDTGIGELEIKAPDNIKLKTFIDSLKDQLEIGKLDLIINFLDGEKYDTSELESKIEELENEVREKDEQIEGLEDDVDELKTGTVIDAGIDIIEYKEPGNLLLIDLMENLNKAISRTTPLRVSEVLQSIN
jgi:predicted RNase H-like nuclease (RuvC/YqgF family)